MKTLRILAIFVYLIAGAAAVEHTLHTQVTVDRTSKPPKSVLALEVREKGKGSPNPDGDVVVDAGSKNPANYEVRFTKNNAVQVVPLTGVKALGKGYTSAFILFARDDYELKTDGKYTVGLKKGAWRMRDGSVYSGPATALAPLDGALKYNNDYLVERYFFEKSAKIETGTSKGSLTLRWNYVSGSDPYDTANDGDWHLSFKGDAGITLDEDDRFDFSNSLNLDLAAFYRTPWPTEPNAAFRVFGDLGINMEGSSDQVFENIEVSGGAFARFIVGNPLTDYLSEHVIFGGGPTATLSPIFEIEYHGVATVDYDADRRMDVGSQRVSVGMHWAWPLARDREWFTAFGVETPYNLDLVSSIEGSYDVDESKWTDNSSIVLELAPVPGRGDDLPTFTLSYVRGEVKPTFRNFDALLAGIKYKF